jgi:hypothetical protein
LVPALGFSVEVDDIDPLYRVGVTWIERGAAARGIEESGMEGNPEPKPA